MNLLGSSLRSRIVRSTALVSASAMLAVVVTAVVVLNAFTDDRVESALSSKFDAQAATVVLRGGKVVELETPDDVIESSSWVYDAAGTAVERPKAGANIQAVADTLARVDVPTRIERDDRAFLAGPVTDEETGAVIGVVVVTEDLDPYESTRAIVIGGLVLLGLLTTAGTVAVSVWSVRRTLLPVQSMAVRARDWSEHELDARFDIAGGDQEITDLGRTLNSLLDQVANAIRNEQRLTSELAHELRTPLTAIRGETELALLAGPGETAAETAVRLQRVRDLVDTMSSTITTLLAAARHDAERRTTADLRSVIEKVMAAMPDHGAIRIESRSPGSPQVAAPAELIERALAPLVDNAVRHARAEVAIETSVDGRFAVVSVSDDGAGIAGADAAERVFEPGVSSSPQGSGLGLPLSRRMARMLGGEVTIASASDPTTFRLTVPIS